MRFKNKAQAWGFDLIVASTVFLVGMIIFYVYAINNSAQSEEAYNRLSYDGNAIADSLLSEGSPADWNSANVVFIGILSQNEINSTKLLQFHDLSQNNYNKTKAMFNTPYNYYLNFSSQITIESTIIQGIGMDYDSPRNLIKISRFTIYNGKPITLNLYMWN